MSAELKPCPFCGVQMQIGAETIFGPRWIHPWDDCCPANTIRFHVTSVDRIAAWNARANDATLASQAAEIERMMESLSEAIRLFKSKRLALNSQYEAIDVLREDGVYSIVIADLEEIRARAALDGEKP